MSNHLENPVQSLCDYVSYPSVSADSNFNDGVAEARNFAISLLKELDFEVEDNTHSNSSSNFGKRGEPKLA